MIATLLCVAFVIVASVTDVRSRKIYNATTYPGIATALALNAAGSIWAYATDSELAELPHHDVMGWIGIGESLVGFVACGFLMLVCFVFFGVGGGDVKLLAMVGAFLGLHQGVEALLWTFILGGCLGVIVLIWRVGLVTLLGRVFRQVFYILRLGTTASLTTEERRELKSELFLAPCAVAGVLIVKFSWWRLM